MKKKKNPTDLPIQGYVKAHDEIKALCNIECNFSICMHSFLFFLLDSPVTQYNK